ncbi:hypothetical protein PMZ80_009163 [Knufia obscura]|uniref:Uncharacterized protein n=2 Tax=Knufia TaxID=430999 RepID=A0AAN8ENB9_9EURO|nr:hypothetical protein PMZ80_009163 [Knufia obscura]KAK5954882.1 hypothetical protein OHC33_003560 [Knufia fluminis]
MPRRWLSVRGRKEEEKANQGIGEAHLQQDFDFAFAADDQLQGGCQGPAPPEELRPNTSGGKPFRAKQKPDLTLLIERPKSSDSLIHNTPLSAARLDGSQIGVAFGSPRHPPQLLESIVSTMSPDQQHHACFFDGPSPAQPVKGKKWKLGDFFRPRANSNKGSNFYQVQQLDAVGTKKLGLPITRTPWRNPRSPLIVQDGFDEQTPPNATGDVSKAVLPSIPGTGSGTQQQDSPTLPPLKVSVPGTPLERYSVMFKDVNGIKQSGLLVRRSKDLDQLVIATHVTQEGSELVVPKLTRRATSPTTSKHQETSRICNNGQASSKYSLFPATPTSIKFLTQTDSPGLTRTRSATGPPQLSPTPALPSMGSEGHGAGSDQRLMSSEVTADSKTLTNLTVAQNPHISAQDEIFFDIKSFRDSHGQVGQQFEMTRPPSTAVQLARSKSSARRLLQEKLDAKAQAQEQEANEERAERTTSVQIDETIAIVESLTSPSGSGLALQHLPQTTYSPESKLDSSQGGGEKIDAMDAESTNTKTARRKSELRTRLEGLNIDVPSPVLELAEETTPKQLHTTGSEATPEKQPTHVAQVAASPVSAISSPGTRTRTPSPPPALPIKDSKYIPLSKYAPKRTTEDLVRQTGLRPVRPTRSNTDNMTTWNARTTSLARPPRPERSSTMPPTNPIPQSRYSKLPPPVVAGPGTNSKGPSMVAYAKPAAEVFVARTVSLSRRPSARVIAPKFPTRTASKREPVQEEEVKEKKVALGIPVVQEVHKGHKPGLSQSGVLETATIAPSSPPPPMPSPPMPPRALQEPPSPTISELSTH